MEAVVMPERKMKSVEVDGILGVVTMFATASCRTDRVEGWI